MKKQSFFYGAAVLAAASILCKIMSAALKIPLDRLFLHEEGIGIYQSAYSIYNVFLAFCVTGIPIALSSLVAGESDEEAASLVKSTCFAVSLLGAAAAALIFLFSEPLARLLSGGGAAVAAPSLKMLAPALLVMGVVSSRKGYFQGRSVMTPSALGQLGESVAKVVLGIALCAFFVRWGISYGAAGAIGGVTAGALVQAALLEIFFLREKKEKGLFSAKKALTVFKISIPMTLGAFGFTAVMLLDTLTVPRLLALGGAETLERLRLFGHLTRANTIYNLPATVISAFTASAVPAIALTRAENNTAGMGENSVRAIKLIFLAAMPCAFGMIFFPQQLLQFIYSSQEYWQLLALSGVMVLIMPYIQTTTAMLQTLGRVWSPIWVTLGSIALKGVLNVVFVKSKGITGAPLATIAAFLPALVFNTVMLLRVVPLKGAAVNVLKIMLCALISCGGARLIYSMSGTVWALAGCIALAAAVYFVLVFLTGCITKNELLGKGQN